MGRDTTIAELRTRWFLICVVMTWKIMSNSLARRKVF